MDRRFDLSVAALSVESSRGLHALLRRFSPAGSFQAVSTHCSVLFGGGATLWFLERRRNAAQLGGTAAIASSPAVSRLEHSIPGPQDRPSPGRLACEQASTGAEYLREQRLSDATFDGAREPPPALADGKVRALVPGAPILRHPTFTAFKGRITALPITFERVSSDARRPGLHDSLGVSP